MANAKVFLLLMQCSHCSAGTPVTLFSSSHAHGLMIATIRLLTGTQSMLASPAYYPTSPGSALSMIEANLGTILDYND
jgi:hypothetical protein